MFENKEKTIPNTASDKLTDLEKRPEPKPALDFALPRQVLENILPEFHGSDLFRPTRWSPSRSPVNSKLKEKVLSQSDKFSSVAPSIVSGSKFTILGELHVPEMGDFKHKLSLLMPELKKAGLTVLAIERNKKYQFIVDSLSPGNLHAASELLKKIPNISAGEISMVVHAIDVGIDVRLFNDIGTKMPISGTDRREQNMFKNLIKGVSADDRVLVYVGRSHAKKESMRTNGLAQTNTLTQRIVKEYGAKNVTSIGVLSPNEKVFSADRESPRVRDLVSNELGHSLILGDVEGVQNKLRSYDFDFVVFASNSECPGL